MNKYKFNYQLLQKLTDIVPMSQREFEMRTGFKYAQIYYWLRIHDIPLDKLITICDTFHIPISHFIVLASEDITISDKANDYIKKNYKPIRYDFTLANTDLTIGERMTVREICKLMQCSTKTYCKIYSTNNIHNTMLTLILRMISRADLYLGDYIIDENRPIPLPDGVLRRSDIESKDVINIQQRCKNAETAIKRYQTTSLKYRNEIAKQQTEIKNLKLEIARLRKILRLSEGEGECMVAEDDIVEQRRLPHE